MDQAVILLHYNNYFNRIVKRLETGDAYKDADPNYFICNHINFNPGDGITTSLILGFGANPSAMFESGADYDYLVLQDISVDTYPIVSRWFIIEAHRTRDQQYELVLKRDVLADNYTDVINSPIFLEKGFINDVNDPLLYNSENMNVNQIKQSEFPLKDETECGWVVGYVPADAFNKVEPAYDRVDKDVTMPMAADITVSSLSSWTYWNYCSNNPNYKFMADTAGKRKVSVKIRSHYLGTLNSRTAYQDLVTADYTFYPNTTESGVYSQQNSGRITATAGSPVWNYPQWYTSYEPVTLNQAYLSASVCNNIFNSVRNNSDFNTALNAILGTEIAIGDTSALRQLQDKIILDSSSNTYYKISVITTSEGNPITITSSTTGGQTALDALNNAMTRSTSLGGTYTTFTASNSSTSYALQLSNVGITVYVDLNSDRAHLNDAPYDMFCIPFSDTMQLTTGSETFVCSKNVALGIATEIGRDLGDGTVYDVQLLPYCPNRTLVINSSNPAYNLNLSKVKYDLIKESGTGSSKSAIIWCTESTFQVPITTEDTIVSFTPTTDTPTKLNTESYYQIKVLAHEVLRRAISTTDDNDILVYKVEKATNNVISSGWYNTIEMLSTDTLRIYTYGRSGYPEINITFSEYDAADYYYVFWMKNVGYGSQSVIMFRATLKIAEAYGILNPGSTAINRKLANECDVVRLVSQNYSAIFEFSPAKSGGVDGFIADCTYKPWSPYIHILPRLKGLYGDNFVAIDDARGLICGGDMSLPQLSNAWANYQLQNKTYQEMFDREIKHLDVQNDVNAQGAIAQAIAAPISGGATGALVGAKMGGYGAIAGAAVGAIGGGITGGLDAANTFRLMEENRQYAIDMYGYNLQNIQAIPTSLTKTSALTYNTRIWPFIEYYTCTDAEKEALKDKITYNGMTIMKIGKLNNYTLGEDNFYKGQLIRMSDIKADSHVVYEIYNELDKGVYL